MRFVAYNPAISTPRSSTWLQGGNETKNPDNPTTFTIEVFLTLLRSRFLYWFDTNNVYEKHLVYPSNKWLPADNFHVQVCTRTIHFLTINLFIIHDSKGYPNTHKTSPNNRDSHYQSIIHLLHMFPYANKHELWKINQKWKKYFMPP